jgi:hypothetical protein
VELTSALDLSPDLRFGLGFSLGFSTSAQAIVYLQSGTGTVSDQRVSAKVKPSFAPLASVAYKNWTFMYRAENRSDLTLDTDATARIFSGASAGVDFAYVSRSTLFFEPNTFTLLNHQELSSDLNLVAGISYQMWGRFTPRALVIQSGVNVNCNGNGSCSSLFSSGSSPVYSARNLWVPLLGLSQKFGDQEFQLNYRFKDSIFRTLPDGNSLGNYLDPPRHELRLGWNHVTQRGWGVSLFLDVSRMSSQNVVISNSTAIGAPGYTASGWLYGGGFNVGIPFKNE